MSRATQLLKLYEMAIGPDQIFYHGTKHKFDHFDIEFTGAGHNQEGPGFYFTTDFHSARGYAFPNGEVIEVRLNMPNLVSRTGPVTRQVQQQARALMMKAPNLKATLEDWGEEYKAAFEQAFKLFIDRDSPKEVFEQIWWDFYKYSAAEWIKNMVDLGYQGLEVEQYPANGGEPACIHAVVYDLNSIKIVGRKPYGKD